MAFPICDGCASSGILCEACQKRAREGELPELDVLLSSILSGFKITGYERAIDLETKLVIFASDEEAKAIIGPSGRTAEELSKKLGRKVIVISKSMDKESIAKSLARPSRMLSRNVIYKEGGVEAIKLIFDKPIDEGSLNLIKELAAGIEISYKPLESHK